MDRPLARSKVERLTPWRAAIADRVSPALTEYVLALEDDEVEVARELEDDDEPEGPRSKTSPG